MGPGSTRSAGRLEIARMKVMGSLAAVALLLVVAAPYPPAAHGAGKPAAPPALVMKKTPVSVVLPDTVLARVLFARGSTDVTLSRFRKAAQGFRMDPQAVTPQAYGQVLDLLVQQRTLAAHVGTMPRVWTRADSSEYRTLVDRLTLTAALDSALYELAAGMAQRGDTVPDKRILGMMARDSAIARLHPVYDEYMLQMLAADFSALPKSTPDMPIMEQIRVAGMLPKVTAADSARTLITSSKGSYTVGQLLADYGRLAPTYRPHIQTARDVRDVANSTIYENILHEAIKAQDLERRPGIASVLADRAEFLDVQSFVRREVYGKVPTDSLTLLRNFRAHPRDFDVWGRAEIVRMVFGTRHAADSLARELTVPGKAESLAAQSERGGAPFKTVLTQDADTMLFARVQRGGVGSVIGPDETIDGWRVMKVMAITPRRPRTFAEARELVGRDWVEREGDRQLGQVLKRLQASTLVQVNEKLRARLTRNAPAAGRGAAHAPARTPGGAR
jgi:hypothetical protein